MHLASLHKVVNHHVSYLVNIFGIEIHVDNKYFKLLYTQQFVIVVSRSKMSKEITSW